MKNNTLQGVVIACYKYDYWLARISIASVRYFYPQIPIYLLVDEASGTFSTKDAEEFWDVNILDVGRKQWGNPGSRLSLLNADISGRYLYIDSDVCFLGEVIERLESIDEQFIVSGSVISDPCSTHVFDLYYKFDELKISDPDFIYPGYVFNGGQFVFTTNVIPQERLDDVFDMSGKPSLKMKGLKMLDQGGLSYLLPRLAQDGLLTIRSEYFKLFASEKHQEFMDLDLSLIQSGKDYPFVAHWAGEKFGRLSQFPRGDILIFFNDYYYSKLSYGNVRKIWSSCMRFFRYSRLSFIKNIKITGIKILQFFGLR